MEIVIIILVSIFFAFSITLIKMVLTSMRQGFILKKDHLYVVIGYLVSSLILGGAFYVAFGVFFIFAAAFGGVDYRTYLLYCFGPPQIVLLPLFTFLFFKNSENKVETSIPVSDVDESKEVGKT